MENSAHDLVRLFEKMASVFSPEELGERVSGAASRDFSNYVQEENLSVEQAIVKLSDQNAVRKHIRIAQKAVELTHEQNISSE